MVDELQRTPAAVTGVVRPVPAAVTERGRRTRAGLVKAAREIFERDGYLEARITDISRAANVAHGTFYTYFSSKDEVFREVIRAVQASLLAVPASDGRQAGGEIAASVDPISRIEAANRAYVAAYRQNARMIGLLEQVSTFNDDLRQIRLDVRRAFVIRAGRAISRWQAEGLADPSLDPRYTASALCNMVDRFTYTWLVLGEQFEEELVIATLTQLWAQALKLDRARSADGGDD